MFKSKILLAIGAALMVAFSVMAVQLHSAKTDTELLTAQVTGLHAVVATKQAEVTSLAGAVETANATTKQLLAERELVAAVRAKAAENEARLRTELHQLNAKVDELRVSSNDHVKEWANTLVPADAVRLLKYATQSRNPDGDGNRSGLPEPTGRLTAQLSANHRF
ncbi:hypothetical protein [Arsukibacterium indicum]|uniref:Uncharacterized protein n=1 Tax=Arsukibacterium indicum TaxID=2848612 RepID=A0ABS6MHC5_9GAMM|nr:hypothetical protein [Arsukibacterium indicum]MBV2128170.1 hypothetical protein [Arsukibacterium indicum]